MDRLPQKVLSLGDIVSLSFRRCRQNARLYWKVFIVPALGAAVGTNGAFFAFFHWVQIASKSMLAIGPFAAHMALVLAGLVVWGLSVWELILRSCAIIRFTLGLDEDFDACYKQAKSRSRSLYWVYNMIVFPPLLILLLWTLAAVTLITHLPNEQPFRFIIGSLGFGFIGFGITVSAALSGLFAALSVSVVASESLTFKEAISRAFYFFKKRMLRGGSFMCLMTVSLVLLYIACFSPIFVVDIVETYSHVDLGLTSHSVLVQFLQTILDTCFNVVSFGVGFTGYGIFYHDLRLRLEGSDMLNKIEAL